MFNAKNQCYQDQYHRNILSGTKFQMNNQQIKFQFDKIEQIDSILSKNDQIYKNLKKQLEQISQAQKNITNNINAIRPIYQYSTYRSKENSLMIYEKFLYDDSIEGQKTLQFDNYQSSSIQTERQPYQINNKKGVQNLDNVYADNEHGNEENSQSLHQKQVQIKDNPETNNFRGSNTSDINDRNSQLLIRKSTSSISSNPYIKNSNLVSSNRNLSYSNLRQSNSRIVEKQKQNYYFPNNSYEPYIDSIVNMNFGEISHRKKEIEQIYDQLKKQQEEIQQAYQEYKKGFIEMKNMSTNKKQQNIIKSPPKKSSPKKSFFKGKKNPQQSQQNISMSKVSVHSSKIQSKVQVTPISMNFTKQNNLNKRNEMAIPQSNEKLAFSPIKQSVMKYCTQEIQSIGIPQRPQKMTALSHVYIPFNKLYKSPIIQMKNKNILILARQSKLVQQKPAQQKILDGKKYKFTQNIQTDEQQLIKNIIKRDHNIIAIVGGQATLKKKLHMAIIAHSFQKMIKIINSKEYNCLTFTLFYHELVDKSQHPSQKISNSIEITEQTQTKKIIQQAQKTIQEIYDAIKRIYTLNESSGFSKAPLQSNKDKTKIVRFTKLALMFGKQCIWSCQMFSTNQFTYEFLKNLQVKNIIWSINPLIKNYDEVSKTLNEAAKYIQNKIQN